MHDPRFTPLNLPHENFEILCVCDTVLYILCFGCMDCRQRTFRNLSRAAEIISCSSPFLSLPPSLLEPSEAGTENQLQRNVDLRAESFRPSDTPETSKSELRLSEESDYFLFPFPTPRTFLMLENGRGRSLPVARSPMAKRKSPPSEGKGKYAESKSTLVAFARIKSLDKPTTSLQLRPFVRAGTEPRQRCLSFA